MKYVVTLLLLTPLITFAQSNDAAWYLFEFSGFISNVALPVLFGIAFLMFLVNSVRYFIIEGDSEDGRDKAKRSALWSVAAFVFLFSLWTIITLVLNGLNLTDREAICPDYLQATGDCSLATQGDIEGNNFGSINRAPSSGPRPVTNPGTNGSSGSNGTTNGSSADEPKGYPLAELVFGTGKDSAIFVAGAQPAGVSASTPTISRTASCVEGMNTLRTAATKESSQAAFVYVSGQNDRFWQDVTHAHNQNYIGYNQALVTSLIDDYGSTAVHLIHIHPDSRIDALGLNMNAHGPTRADFSFSCALNDTRVGYHVVDELGVWSHSIQDDTCPYLPAVEPQLSLIETYLSLSVMDSISRTPELQRYVDSTLTNAFYDTHFSQYLSGSLRDLSSTELRDLSLPQQRTASTSVSFLADVAEFCNEIE